MNIETTDSDKVNKFIGEKEINKVIVFGSSVSVLFFDGSSVDIYAGGQGELIYELIH